MNYILYCHLGTHDKHANDRGWREVKGMKWGVKLSGSLQMGSISPMLGVVDEKPKVRIEFVKIRRKKSTHGWAHGWSHDRAAEAETAF